MMGTAHAFPTLRSYIGNMPAVEMMIYRPLVVGRVQHFHQTRQIFVMLLSCWMSIVQHDLRSKSKCFLHLSFIFIV